MKRDPEVTFAVDDDDTLYVQFSGDLEVQFTDSETEAFMGSIKETGGEALDKGLTAQGMEMCIALAQTMVAPVLAGLKTQYDVDMDEEQFVRVHQEMVDLLPGFIHHVMGIESSEGEE